MAKVSNVSKYYRQLKKLQEQYPDILNGEILTHFIIAGKRVLSYYVYKGASEICATVRYLAEKHGVLYDDVALTCKRVENKKARAEHKRKEFFTVITLGDSYGT